MTMRSRGVGAGLIAGVLAVAVVCAAATVTQSILAQDAGAVEVNVAPDACAVSSYFDSATGCEYLRASCGGITPRLTPGGRPLCRPLNPGSSASGAK